MEDGKKVFVVDCLELGISDFGETIDEALNNLKEAIKLLLEEAPEKRELLEIPKRILNTRLDL
ncbi:type II toxin-antitoxin system HicB family antitoxin [Candidatus Pacearchaeota archaeon]|nr:type II toxin-antitoxin system HicB family antitoxin [Candidatus Pacearchaeota archaeon]